MENLTVSLNAVLPLFLIMAAGYASKRMGLIREEDIPRFNKIAFRIFLPLLLYYDIYISDLSTAVRPRLLIFAVAGVIGVYLLTLVFILAVEKVPEKRAVMIQGIYRSNYVLIGLPIASVLVPESELCVIAILIAVIVPIYNALAVITLEIFNSRKTSPGRIALSVLENPLIIGSVLGILTLVLKIRLPDFLTEAVRDMSYAGLPLQLFLLGSFFRFSGLSEHRRELIVTTVGRLVVVPAILLPAAAAMGFRGSEFVALLGCFASSNAVSSFTMTQEMGGDAALAGDIVVVTSAFCAVTLFGWTFLYKSLGMF